MARILTVLPETASGVRRLLVAAVKRQNAGAVPGMMQILLVDGVCHLRHAALIAFAQVEQDMERAKDDCRDRKPRLSRPADPIR